MFTIFCQKRAIFTFFGLKMHSFGLWLLINYSRSWLEYELPYTPHEGPFKTSVCMHTGLAWGF